MPQPTVYDPHLGQFLRTFNIRYTHKGLTFELPIVAASWQEAESMLIDLKMSGEIFSELIETIDSSN